jgi:transcriptional regulator with XRE-family HTH domain
MKSATAEVRKLARNRGIALRSLREARGFTLKDLEKRSGIHWCTIMQNELGRRINPEKDTIRALSRVLGPQVFRIYSDPCYRGQRQRLLSPALPNPPAPPRAITADQLFHQAVDMEAKSVVKAAVAKAVKVERDRFLSLLTQMGMQIAEAISPVATAIQSPTVEVRSIKVPRRPRIRRRRFTFASRGAVQGAICQSPGRRATSIQIAEKCGFSRDTARRWATLLCKEGKLRSFKHGSQHYFAEPVLEMRQ